VASGNHELVTAAIVPVKHLAAGKSRLAKALGRDGAERLALAMLEDVLAALRGVRRLDAIGVVTPDPTVAAVAERTGARALLGDDPGLNESIDRAARELGDAASDGTLVVLGDVAGARSGDLEQMLGALSGANAPCVVLAPARDGGTAALARNPHAAIPSRFGASSAAAHRDAARAAQVALIELPLSSLAIDLDDADALRAFLATSGGGELTRAALRALGVATPA
jgi:2-phospho-L-lactate guanylyltransferase